MTSERRFRRSVLLTALAGQCAYAMAAEKPGLALIALLTAGLSWWLVREALSGRPRPVPRWLLNGLVLTAIVFLVFQLMSRSQEPITSLTDFLAYVMLVKSLDRARMRDEAQLLGLSLFVVIGALLTGQGLGMGVALLAYTPLAIVSTVTLQLYAARERQRDLLRSVGLTEGLSALDTQLERQRAPRAVAVVAVVCAAASMTAGVGAFIVTPRQLAQQLGVASSPFVKSPATDFSDQIQLGSAGTISQDGTPVMDVRLVPESGWAGPRSGPIYLRGAVLTNYDRNSMTWKGASRSDAAADALGGEVSARNRLTALLDAPARGRTEYEVVLRATRSNADATLFAPLQPVGAATQAEGKIVYRPSDATLRLAPSPGGRVVYTVTCVSDYRDPSRADGVREREASPARIRELALRLLKERSVDADPFSKGPLEVRRSAQAIVAYLGTFPYTLEMIAPPEGVDPIEMFLFDTRRGHCEYFAAGMVAMLRSVGVPARIATGYVAAEYNNVSGYYTVRRSDAHAWVEAELEPGRWETFDPTPAGELQVNRRATGGPVGWIKHLWDAVEFSWLDNVVAYDKGIKLDVIGLAGRADPGAAAVKWQHRVRVWQNWVRAHLPESALTRSVLVGLATFVVVLGGYGVTRLVRRWARTLPKKLVNWLLPQKAGVATGVMVPVEAMFYSDALRALAAAGRAKPVTSPPLAFAGTLDGASAAAMSTVASLYYRSRFGGGLSEAERREGRAAAAELKSALGSRAVAQVRERRR